VEKSAVAERSFVVGHDILLNNTNPLIKKSRRRDRHIREAIEFELHPINMNREEGFSLGRPWKPSIYSLKNKRRFSPRTR
jgi:hypothetical protein